MADRPLRPATRLRLGEPLPHQLPDRPRDHPPAADLSSPDHAIRREYPVLIQVSLGYPGLGGRFLTCYAPVRRFPRRNLTEPTLLARLACIKRTANVRPEPGSNSPSKFFDENDPVSARRADQECFIPQKDADTRGRGSSSMCDRWLVYAHRRPPSCVVCGKRLSISIVRLPAHDRRTVQLSRSPDPARTVPSRSPRGLTVYRRSEQATVAGVTGRSGKVHNSKS